jgi:hypothetical protein
MARVVRLPQQYWDIIDAEAARCKRSGEKQLEALLCRVFGFGNVEIEINENGVLANLKGIKPSAAVSKKAKGAAKQKAKK